MEYTMTDQLLGGGWHWIAAAILFGLIYLAGIMEKPGRAVVSAAAVGALLLLGILSIREAFIDAIIWETLLLVAGVLLLTGLLGRFGVFMHMAVRALSLAQGRSGRLLALLMLLSALLSALLDQLGTVLLLMPLAITAAQLLRISAFPYMVGILISSHIGGAATLVGSPANMLIGASAKLSFWEFVRHLGPPLLLALGVSMVSLLLVYRARLRVSPAVRAKLIKQTAAAAEQTTARGSWIGWGVLLAVIICLLLHGWLDIPAYAIVWSGAVALAVAGGVGTIKGAAVALDWKLLTYIAGLLIVVSALEKTGITHYLAGLALQMTEGHAVAATQLVLWTSGLVSASADQLPLVAGAIPIIEEMGMFLNSVNAPSWDGGWWALALGAGLGGSATLLGSSASIVAAGMVAKQGEPVSFLRYSLIGIPLALISLAISAAYLYFFYT
ncbi:hypothetical protein PA598K_02207 [Paenibacillus sp. 598K]|uniref:SLC13 family permease n=1 Tax=Paenibacillus sp. 598K TaxID=1117987 RepID=UPI000FF98760|nr:SLC13 family permease [Paenibacillus sp. 598K]GBF73883.1 hypothetical protein PA598K_02207 [Paenibacillus sp. 598K]